jgi:hypothetical protein
LDALVHALDNTVSTFVLFVYVFLLSGVIIVFPKYFRAEAMSLLIYEPVIENRFGDTSGQY